MSTLSLPWVEKYRPISRKDLVGNEIAINGLYVFLKKWKFGKSKTGVLLLGPAGCGKTSSTYAIANELGFSVSELNASDTRAKSSLREKLGVIAEFRSLEDDEGTKGRLILMDEIDGLSGQKDRGGLPEFIKILKKSFYPVICTANDPESDKVERLRRELRVFEFFRLDEFEIFDLLSTIIEKEKISIDDDIIEEIAENAAGDIRAAINELESHNQGSSQVMLEKRDKMMVLSELFNQLFQSKTYQEARSVMNNAPSDYYRLLLHLVDETSKQCRTSKELALAYNQLALADLTYTRIMKTQDWSMLKHFFTYIGPGVSLSRDASYHTKIRNISKYPSAFMVRGIAKRKLARAIKIAPDVAPQLHISKNRFIFKEFDLFSKILLGKQGAEIAAWLNLDNDQIDALQKIQPNSPLTEEIEEARMKVGVIRLEQGYEIAKIQDPFDVDPFVISTASEDVSTKENEQVSNNEDTEEKTSEGQHSLDDYF